MHFKMKTKIIMTRVRGSLSLFVCGSPWTDWMLWLHMQFLNQRDAQRFDEELMSSVWGFSIDQLMELAGLSVACAVDKEFPCKSGANVLVVAGPGNNG